MGFFSFLYDVIIYDIENRSVGTRRQRKKSDKHELEIGNPISSFFKSFDSNVLMEMVIPIPGCIVYCDLGIGTAEHTGIYIGRNRIVHLNGDGLIEKVTTKQFMNRLGGLNSAISVYVSCKDGVPVGSRSAAAYARSMIGVRQKYSLISNNCHRFTSICLLGTRRGSVAAFFLLKNQAQQSIGFTDWRAWKI